MPKPLTPVAALPARLLRFSWRVLRAFRRNRGLLVAGGVGYNVLLSMVPLFAITVVGFSLLFDEAIILETIRHELTRLLPGSTDAVLAAVRGILAERDVIGLVGLAVLVFFSTMAFRMLEDAMAMIFREPRRPRRRNPWLAALVPYAYVGLLVLALMALTLVRGALAGIGQEQANLTLWGWQVATESLSSWTFDLLTFGGLVVLFYSIYRVLPPVNVSPRRAMAGGLTAAILWELTSRLLVHYFARISLVSVIYGSLAAAIIVLVSMEIGAIILLLGAQVIAELERSSEAGVPWWIEPEA